MISMSWDGIARRGQFFDPDYPAFFVAACGKGVNFSTAAGQRTTSLCTAGQCCVWGDCLRNVCVCGRCLCLCEMPLTVGAGLPANPSLAQIQAPGSQPPVQRHERPAPSEPGDRGSRRNEGIGDRCGSAAERADGDLGPGRICIGSCEVESSQARPAPTGRACAYTSESVVTMSVSAASSAGNFH